MTIIICQPFLSPVEPAFWHALNNIKIDVLKLSDGFVIVTGSYTSGRSITDIEMGQEIAMPPAFTLAGDAFNEDPQIPKHAISMTSLLKNHDTVEELEAADISVLFRQHPHEIIGDFERLLEGSRVGGGFQNGQYMHFWLSAQISV